jgi:hypothetical protein
MKFKKRTKKKRIALISFHFGQLVFGRVQTLKKLNE